jgi:hypothetical protein
MMLLIQGDAPLLATGDGQRTDVNTLILGIAILPSKNSLTGEKGKDEGPSMRIFATS